jgi:hypothetical protein
MNARQTKKKRKNMLRKMLSNSNLSCVPMFKIPKHAPFSLLMAMHEYQAEVTFRRIGMLK